MRLITHPDIGTEPWLDVAVAAVTQIDGTSVSTTDVDALTLGDRNALLLALLRVTYGEHLSWAFECEVCGERLDVEVHIDDLLRITSAPRERDVAAVFRLPTPADLVAISGLDIPAARDELVQRCITGAIDLDEQSIADIEEAMSHADPLADVELALRCDACAHVAYASVDLTAELLSRLARESAMTQDVHALALAYGWTEADVLELTRPRRHEYLAYVADLTS